MSSDGGLRTSQPAHWTKQLPFPGIGSDSATHQSRMKRQCDTREQNATSGYLSVLLKGLGAHVLR
eukprot:3874768-Prymnesium_polylepis.1